MGEWWSDDGVGTGHRREEGQEGRGAEEGGVRNDYGREEELEVGRVEDCL